MRVHRKGTKHHPEMRDSDDDSNSSGSGSSSSAVRKDRGAPRHRRANRELEKWRKRGKRVGEGKDVKPLKGEAARAVDDGPCVSHRVKAISPFAYSSRYIPEAYGCILFPYVAVAVTVEGPFSELGVVTFVENVRAVVEKRIIRPWAFSIVVNKEQGPVPERLVENWGNPLTVIPVRFIPSAEGTAAYIFKTIRRDIEKGLGLKLVSVEVQVESQGPFSGVAVDEGRD